MNPEPHNLYPKPETRNSKSETRNPKPRTQNPNPKPETQTHKPQTRKQAKKEEPEEEEFLGNLIISGIDTVEHDPFINSQLDVTQSTLGPDLV